VPGYGEPMPRRDAEHGTLTVFYDERCGFCTAVAAWLTRHGGGTLRHEPIGSSAGGVALRDVAPEHRYASVHVLDAYGRRWSGASSLPILARAVPGLRWTARPLDSLPAVTALGYDLVTRHRARLSTLLALRSARDATARSRDDIGTRPRTSSR
jgi:predicted DCC family thiol-disulfide oxidoreductase YuxK